jgi:hypothetical protein
VVAGRPVDRVRLDARRRRAGDLPDAGRRQSAGALTRTPDHVSNHTPSWSPKGRYIVFSSDRVSFENYEIFRMRADGRAVTRLTHTAEGIDDNAPEYSPTAGASPSRAPATEVSRTFSR